MDMSEAEVAWCSEDWLRHGSQGECQEVKSACLPGNSLVAPGHFGQSDVDHGAISATTQTSKTTPVSGLTP